MTDPDEPVGDEPMPGDELQQILADDPGYLEFLESTGECNAQ